MTAIHIYRAQWIVNTDQQCEGKASGTKAGSESPRPDSRAQGRVCPGLAARTLRGCRRLLQEEQLRAHAVLFSREERLIWKYSKGSRTEEELNLFRAARER